VTFLEPELFNAEFELKAFAGTNRISSEVAGIDE